MYSRKVMYTICPPGRRSEQQAINACPPLVWAFVPSPLNYPCNLAMQKSCVRFPSYPTVQSLFTNSFLSSMIFLHLQKRSDTNSASNKRRNLTDVAVGRCCESRLQARFAATGRARLRAVGGLCGGSLTTDDLEGSDCALLAVGQDGGLEDERRYSGAGGRDSRHHSTTTSVGGGEGGAVGNTRPDDLVAKRVGGREHAGGRSEVA